LNHIQIVDKIIPLDEKSNKTPHKINNFSPKTHGKFKLLANLFFRFGKTTKKQTNKKSGSDPTPSLLILNDVPPNFLRDPNVSPKLK
jgi:hypothetical protein